jgi:hypothetical protein
MIRALVQPDDRPTRTDCAYNLFRNKRHSDILCAVPEDRCVPDFITGKAWSFDSKVTDRAQQPPGFDPEAAQVAVRFNGFYLFQLTGTKRRAAASLRVLSNPLQRTRPCPQQLSAA